FETERNKRSSEYVLDFSRQNAQSWNNVYLAPRSPDLYSACLGALEKENLRIEVNKSNLSPDALNIPITIRFVAAPDDSTTREISINEIGGKLAINSRERERMQHFKGSLNISAVFVRKSTTLDALLSLNIIGNVSTAQ